MMLSLIALNSGQHLLESTSSYEIKPDGLITSYLLCVVAPIIHMKYKCYIKLC